VVCTFNREKAMNVEHRVKKIVSDQLGIDISQVHNHSAFVADLGGDSLDTVEMLLGLEDEFGFEVDEEIAEELHTVQSVIDLVNSKLTEDR
jgi:acyl carrier protein